MITPIPARIKRTQRDYSLGFKLQVVDAVEKGDMTYKQSQSIYGIQGRSTVLTWLRKHGKMNWTQPVRITMPNTPKTKETPLRQLSALKSSWKMSTYVIYYSMKLLILLMQSMEQA